MILERAQDGTQMVTSLAFPRREPRAGFLSLLAQMARAFRTRMRRSA